MTITALRRKTAKGEPAEEASELRLIAGRGIEGDVNAGKLNRQVCLIPEPASRSREADGLCSPRFQANVEMDRAPEGGWVLGSRWKASDAVLEIEQVGKDCYPECEAFGRNGPCSLARECAFASVVVGGIVRLGERFDAL